MRTPCKAARIAQGALLTLAFVALLAAGSSGALLSAPRVSTGGVKHVRGTSGQLDAVVNPNGLPTSYFFEYGPTVAYGKSTTPVAVGAGTKGVKVGQLVSGILPGYHYRVVATFTTTGGTPERVNGKDKSFSGGKTSKLRFNIPKAKESETPTVEYGGTAEVTGTLVGLGNTAHGVLLQATPYPYTETFAAIGRPILTNGSGHFTFRIANMHQNTEFRLLTTDSRPLFSSIVTVRVTPRLVLHIRPAGGKGTYRVYGTVAPARLRGVLAIQELKPQKASSKREGPRAKTIGSAEIRKGNSKQARFSVVVTLSGTSSYRVYLRLPAKGGLDSGHSNEVLVHAPKVTAGTKKGRKTKRKRRHAGKRSRASRRH